MTNKSEYIYVLRSVSTGIFKIGRSDKPRRRIEQIQRDSSSLIEMVHLYTCEDSRRVEKELHQRFKSVREHGEWFRLAAEDLKHIESLGLEVATLESLPKAGKSVLISMRIDSELLAFLEDIAERRRWSRNLAIVTLIEMGLPHVEREPVEKVRTATATNRGAEVDVPKVAARIADKINSARSKKNSIAPPRISLGVDLPKSFGVVIGGEPVLSSGPVEFDKDAKDYLASGLSGTPVKMEPFRPKIHERRPDFVSEPIVEEPAPVKLCAACESDLVLMKGKLVCASVGCSLYGQEQKGRK